METTLTPIRRNKASVVSLIAGLLSPLFLLCCFFSIFLGYDALAVPRMYVTFFLVLHLIAAITAITAGIDSLVQIKKSREAGKGCAITGIILGGLIILSYTFLYIHFYYIEMS